MTVDEYIQKRDSIGFEEYPYFITGNENGISSIVDLSQADSQLKIHLAEVIICRCFSATGGVHFPIDLHWFVTDFLLDYKHDFIRPWLTSTIKKAIEFVLSEDSFETGIFGMTFLFGIIEFHAKHLLGYKPLDLDFFDKEGHSEFRNMSIGVAMSKLKRTNTEIGRALNRIDKHTRKRLNEFDIQEDHGVIANLADRINSVRNTVLHGEGHSFYDTGCLLVMVYILFIIHQPQQTS